MSQLVIRYSLFAIQAMVINLLIQRAVLSIVEGSVGFILAMLTGTAGGLITKYILDKNLIFYDPARGLASHTRKFGLYTATGVVTTSVFWAVESGFWLIWGTETAREAGAVIGLTIGYVAKYRLDRRFVFAPQKAGP
jgi:putative flippase GtrA